MPNLPARITVGPVDYTTVVDEQRCRDTDAEYGFTVFRTTEIVLAPDQSVGQMRDTLLHELLHAVTELLGVCKGKDPLVDEGKEEPLVHALSGQLLAVLRQNPALVRFLTETDSADRHVQA